MDASIDFSGILKGSIADGGGSGGGDEVIITPVVTSGTKIADVSVNGVEKDLYCPTPPAPTEVDITPVVTSGTKIADVSVNGVEKDLYCPAPPAPTEVDITPVVTSGTKIADVSIGGVEKDLYTPDYGADITALDGRLDTAEGNITSLTGRVGTAEGNITEIKQSLSQLDGLIIYKDLTPTDDYAEFDDGSSLPLISLISTIEPIQSGSGTPSQDNPRPISGHSDIDIIVSPNSDFSGGTTYSVNFVDGGNPLTVYGGTLDVISGVLTVDRAYVDLGTVNWTKDSQSRWFGLSNPSIDVPNLKPISSNDDVANLICSQYKVTTRNLITSGEGICQNVSGSILIADAYALANYSDSQFKTYMNGVQLVYELATPQTYQLTPTEVDSLVRQNYINSDTGDITNVKYLGVFNLS